MIAKSQVLKREGTWEVKGTSWSAGLSVTGDATGVVAHAGSVAVRLLADRVGLTGALSGATARRGFSPVHDRGRVLVDMATMVAAGGEAIADIDTLRHQQDVLGQVASPPTVWRALDELTTASLKRVAAAPGANAGAKAWGSRGTLPMTPSWPRGSGPDRRAVQVRLGCRSSGLMSTCGGTRARATST